jgi:ABC-2 type transport system ATP-binding protein
VDAIEVDQLVKVYGKPHQGVDGTMQGTVALRDVSLRIRKGEVFGLLGRNGAGKTTFLRICGTQLMPTSGAVKVLGYDVVREVGMIRRNIAVVPQEGRTMEFVTPWEHVYGFLLLRGMSRSDAKLRTRETLAGLDLWEYRDTIAFKLSGGIRQRTLVAMALAADADVYFCDEPTLGLDPVARRKVWSVFEALRRAGKTVLLTTHYMEEAEALSDRLAILHRGRVLACGSLDELRGLVDGSVRVDVGREFPLKELESYGRVIQQQRSLTVLTDEASSEELVNDALKKSVRVSVRPVTLEEVFLELVSRE